MSRKIRTRTPDTNPPNTTEMAQFVRSHLSTGDLLAQLAEEAAELAQAALKLRRAYEGTNPTPISIKEATEALREEYADIRLCLKVADVLGSPVETYDIMDRKLARWCGRLREAGGAAHGKDGL